MTSCGSVLLEHAFAVVRVVLIQIRFIIDQLPSGVLGHLLMLTEALAEVSSEAVV